MRPEDAIEQARQQILAGMWATGTVSGTSGTKVVASIKGGSMTIPRLSSYTPVVGDTIIVASTPIGWICLGKPA